jgi:hypothetical protein
MFMTAAQEEVTTTRFTEVLRDISLLKSEDTFDRHDAPIFTRTLENSDGALDGRLEQFCKAAITHLGVNRDCAYNIPAGSSAWK